MKQDYKLDDESVARLIQMLDSSDKDNELMAITILNQIDLNKCIGHFLTIYKFSECTSYHFWKDSNLLDKIELLENEKLFYSMLGRKHKGWVNQIKDIIIARKDLKGLEIYNKFLEEWRNNVEKTVKNHVTKMRKYE